MKIVSLKFFQNPEPKNHPCLPAPDAVYTTHSSMFKTGCRSTHHLKLSPPNEIVPVKKANEMLSPI